MYYKTYENLSINTAFVVFISVKYFYGKRAISIGLNAGQCTM